MHKFYASFVALAFAFQSGCTFIPDLGELPQPRSIQSFLPQNSDHKDSQKWPKTFWWEDYEDAQLNNCIHKALIQSPSLEEAAARLRVANGYAEQVGAKLAPQTLVNGSYAKMKQSYNYGIPEAFVAKGLQDTASITLDFSYELDFWGRNRDLIAAAISEQQASTFDLEHAKLIVAAAIAETYAELARLYANLDAAEAAFSVRSKTAILLNMRFEKGLENEGSYKQALALKEIAEVEVQAVLELIALTKIKITGLMGAEPHEAEKILRPQIEKLSSLGIPENIPAELMGRRPDIAASRHRVQATVHEIEASAANFYPNINLNAFFGYQSLGLSSFAKSGSRIASFGPALSLPIFNFGELQGRYIQSRGHYEEAVAQYNAVLLQALNDVASVMVSKNKLAIRLQKIESAMTASQRAYDVVNSRYKGGLTTYLEVLRAEDTLIETRRALADIRSRAFTLDVALVKALGGGFTIKQDS